MVIHESWIKERVYGGPAGKRDCTSRPPCENSPMPLPEKAGPELSATDPEDLAKALELELITQRASWQKMRARRGTWRALSFLFLFLVLVGALLAYFYFSIQVSARKGESPSGERIENDR